MDGDRLPATAVRVRCPRCAHVFRIEPASPPATPPPAAAPPAGAGLDGFEVDTRRPMRPRTPPAAPARAAHEPAPRVPRQTWTSEPARTLELGESTPKGPPPRLETAPFRIGDAPPLPPVPSAPAAPPAPAHTVAGGFSSPAPAFAPPAPAAAGFTPPASAPAPGFTPFAPAAPSPPPVPPRREAPGVQTSFAPAAAAARPPAADPAHDRARRLARALVSDILVYNQAVRDRARAEGSLPAALGPEISKAWELFKAKIGPEVATSTPYFKDALNEILAEGEAVF